MSTTMKFLLTTILVLLSGCGDTEKRYNFRHDIVGVYWHINNEFSVAIQQGDRITMTKLPHGIPVDLLANVSEHESMWYECNGSHDNWNGVTKGSCTIHIRSIDSIQGADWSRGKFGSGSTKRLQ